MMGVWGRLTERYKAQMIVLAVAVCTLMFALSPSKARVSKQYVQSHLRDPPLKQDDPPPNTHPATYLRIVGVEGCGHHGVFPFIYRIAAEQGVAVRMDVSAWGHSVDGGFEEYRTSETCNKVRKWTSRIAKHPEWTGLLMNPEWARWTQPSEKGDTRRPYIPTPFSYPFWRQRPAVYEGIGKQAVYDLDWMAHTVEECEPGVEFKVLLLERPFLNTVFSHRRLDKGLAKHGRMLSMHMRWISEELIAKLSSVNDGSAASNDDEAGHLRRLRGLRWARVHYEDFGAERCLALVPALRAFFGWPPRPAEVDAALCAASEFVPSKKDPWQWPHADDARTERERKQRQRELERVVQIEEDAMKEHIWRSFSPHFPWRDLVRRVAG